MYSTHTHLIYNYTFDFVWGKSIDAETVWNALFHFDSSDVNHNIIITSRLPRVVASFSRSISSHIRSTYAGMTRNYLASPSIMGVTDGAALLLHLA